MYKYNIITMLSCFFGSISLGFVSLGLYGHNLSNKAYENSEKLKNNIISINNIDTIKHNNRFIMKFNNNSDAGLLTLYGIKYNENGSNTTRELILKKLINPSLNIPNLRPYKSIPEIQFPGIVESIYGTESYVHKNVPYIPYLKKQFYRYDAQISSFKYISNAHLLVTKSNDKLTYYSIGDPEFIAKTEFNRQKNIGDKLKLIGGVGCTSSMLVSFYIYNKN
jgi:hypothetical protein